MLHATPIFVMKMRGRFWIFRPETVRPKRKWFHIGRAYDFWHVLWCGCSEIRHFFHSSLSSLIPVYLFYVLSKSRPQLYWDLWMFQPYATFMFGIESKTKITALRIFVLEYFLSHSNQRYRVHTEMRMSAEKCVVMHDTVTILMSMIHTSSFSVHFLSIFASLSLSI